MPNEADTCRRYVVPRLQAAGWDNEPYRVNEQVTFTDGRIVATGRYGRRRPGKRADYVLRYRADFPIAVVEAKADYLTAGEGMQQAKEYAEILDLKFAYSTNGHGIVEFDFMTGLERELDAFPTPDELWWRLTAAAPLDRETTQRLLAPYYDLSGKRPRYYQEIAINRAVRAVLQGDRRILLTLATGTGKTFISFQISWKLWSSLWNRTGDHRRPKILFLADRNVLVDDPKDKTFTPFGDARIKIGEDELSYGREMYFAIYQALAKDVNRQGLHCKHVSAKQSIEPTATLPIIPTARFRKALTAGKPGILSGIPNHPDLPEYPRPGLAGSRQTSENTIVPLAKQPPCR